jgi:hypothetical protein
LWTQQSRQKIPSRSVAVVGGEWTDETTTDDDDDEEGTA